MRLRPLAALILLLLPLGCGRPAAAPARPLVVLIGDSTTAGYGGAGGYVLATETPLAAMTALLPATSRWRKAEVVNLGIPSSTTREWAVASLRCKTAPELGPEVHAGLRLAARACPTAAPLVDHVTALVGRPVDLALVVLGTNDPYREAAATPDETVVHLRTIAAKLAPARVLIASPFWTTHPARAAFVEALATRLATAGLLRGPDFARIRLPLDASEVHLTFGGFVASNALWLDALRALD
ncbi:MAG TPA: SGNH/GDSL hydrolase family protein [Candidatus Limnocylindria bacterium]|nr:SGNH/GDSL hydrolase family protein [Candidatus Limnocylindria bacterium]